MVLGRHPIWYIEQGFSKAVSDLPFPPPAEPTSQNCFTNNSVGVVKMHTAD